MTLHSRFQPQISSRSMLVVILLSALALPWFMQVTATPSLAVSPLPEGSGKPGAVKAPSDSEFPYAVAFEQGATKYKAGDNITILEIRGTEKTFVPGNLYCIRGTYKLGPRDQAMLAAFRIGDRACFHLVLSWTLTLGGTTNTESTHRLLSGSVSPCESG